MEGIIKTNGKPTAATIGGVRVFTYSGALEAFRRFARMAQDWEKYGAEGIYALYDENQKMQKLGFSPEELYEIEIQEA